MIKINKVFIVFVFLSFTASTVFCKDYSIVDFGAVADGKTLNTEAIQSAIDRAHEDGGGRVVIPSGYFLSGSIVLKSNIELHLTKKAVLLGSTNPDDYITINRWKGLVMADSANNISVTGKGVLDGQGAELALHIDSLFYIGKVDSADYIFPEKRPSVTIRPQIIEFVNCNKIRVFDIVIKNAASWVQSYFRCRNLTVDGIRVESDTYWNNDGLDVIDCKNVRIINTRINASDDGICLKSYYKGYNGLQDSIMFCDSIYIANCTIRSSASAIKIGTASYRKFSNIVIEKIKVYDTYRSAIALESYQNGIIENILIQNIKAYNTGNAIFIRLGKYYGENRRGSVKNILIRNVKATIPFSSPDYAYEIRGPSLPFFHNIFPSSITGIPNNPVENVTLENIKIIYPGRGNRAYANVPVSRLEDVPEQEDHYPEFSMFGELPAWGFYVRHVNGLTMKNVRIKIKKPDYRPALVFDDVKNLNVESMQIEGDSKPTTVILNNVESANVEYKK